MTTATEKAVDQRWGSGARVGQSDARTRLIEAAHACYERNGIQQTTIGDIAAEACITRRTVYRYFSSQNDILLAVLVRAMDEYWQEMLQALSYQGSFADVVVEALLYSIKYAQNAPRYRYLFGEEAQAFTNKIYIDHPSFAKASAAGLQQIYRLKLAQGLARPEVDMGMLSEWYNRIILSFLSSPSPIYKDEKSLREMFAFLLGPALSP